MFAKEFSQLVQAVIRISKRFDIPAPRVGSADVDKTLVILLEALEAKIEECEAECAKMKEEMKNARDGQGASPKSGDL